MSEIETLSQELGQMLISNNWTITTAESCTGGGISAAITDIAGSSAYFDRSFITYSNQAKSELVGVPSETIDLYGAVSSQVVEAMALGALAKAKANVAIAVSGVAGPGGGSKDKPVGTVYLAIAIQYILDKKPYETVNVTLFNFQGSRKEIRELTIKSSIINALSLIKEKNQ